MSRLKIVDLSFCESELSNINQVQGGILVTSLSTGVQSASVESYSGNWLIKNGVILANISAIAIGTTAGAAAGSASDGSVFSSTFARSTAI